MSELNYWYHAQIRRYLLQFIRIFGNFHTKSGKGKDGSETMYRVPVRYGDMQRMTGHILNKNSDNMMRSTPFMTCQIASLNMAVDRRQNPNHISQIQVFERNFNRDTDSYGSQLGETYSIERYMPVPYDLTMETHIWTTSTDQKLQLLEQILVLFNPSIDIQTSVNPIDWTSLTVVELQDSISWSDRQVPAGTEDTLDIAKLTFKVPIWLSPPVKVKRQKIIHQIVTNIFEGVPDQSFEPEDAAFDWSPVDMATRVIVTPGQHLIRVAANVLTLLDPQGNETTDTGEVHGWAPLLDQYGEVRPGISQIRLRTSADLEDWKHDLIGTIRFHPTDPHKLLWTVDPDTLPAATLPPITAIIDPHRTRPGHGLPAAATGQRYLLTDEMGPNAAWGDPTALANDILEFRGDAWVVSFRAGANPGEHHVLNTYDHSRLRWTGEEWVDAIEADYYPGYWRIAL